MICLLQRLLFKQYSHIGVNFSACRRRLVDRSDGYTDGGRVGMGRVAVPRGLHRYVLYPRWQQVSFILGWAQSHVGSTGMFSTVTLDGNRLALYWGGRSPTWAPQVCSLP